MTRRGPRADVAVYAPLAGPLYEDEPRSMGGAEVQSAYIARSLAEHGLRVRQVVAGAAGVSERDGVEIVRLPAGYGSGGVARRRAVLTALRRADARVYIQRSAGFETAAVGLFARATRGRFVFSSSSVADFSRDPLVALRAGASLDEWPTRAQYLLGLRLAHAVVVQTEDQRALARTQRGVEARVIRSFCAPALVVDPPAPRDAFLWIGGLIGSKDPLVYLDLARRVPEAAFRMVAGDRPGWEELAGEVRARAAATPNLELLPSLRRDQLLGLYSHAVAVVNTSWFEGFPNTFLEGWARGTPALSLRVDPDAAIERHGLGEACGGSLDELGAAARRLWAERDTAERDHLRAYVASQHGPAVVGAQWAALVRKLLE